MTTWTGNPPERPAPGTVPRSAWSRFFEAVGLIHQGPEGPDRTGCVPEAETP